MHFLQSILQRKMCQENARKFISKHAISIFGKPFGLHTSFQSEIAVITRLLEIDALFKTSTMYMEELRTIYALPAAKV